MDVIAESRGYIGWIIMNRENKLNALNRSMSRKIIDYLNKFERDSNVKVIALTGKGRAFCAGVDLGEVADAVNVDEAAEVFRELAALFKKLLTVKKPLIIGVNGSAYGGGAELLWTGDIVVAVRGAKIAWPEARWGLIPPLLSTIGPLVIGPQRASYLALTSTPITAEEAHAMGLISVLVNSVNEMESKIDDISRSIMAHSPHAVSSIKRMVLQSKTGALIELGISELERHSRRLEALEAARSFKEKKQPPKYEW